MPLCSGRGLWWECVCFIQPFYPFQKGYFLVHPLCSNHSASFWISFTGNFSVCSCTFGVFRGGGEFRSLLLHHLGTEPFILFTCFLIFSTNLFLHSNPHINKGISLLQVLRSKTLGSFFHITLFTHTTLPSFSNFKVLSSHCS